MTVDQIRAHIDPIRHEYADPRSLVLPALKFAQTDDGWLSPDSLAAVAEATGFSQAYVESIATFYDRIYLNPVGTRVVSVCVTLSCMLCGSDELLETMRAHLGLEPGHGPATTPDGSVTLQEAQCLGACDRAPCLQVDAEHTIGPIGADDARALLDQLRSEDRPREMWR